VSENLLYAGGDYRVLDAVHPRTKPRGTFGRQFDGADLQLVPRAQWSPITTTAFLPPVTDQNGQWACVGFGSVGAMRAARILSGLEDVHLSAGDLYRRINGGRDAGASITDALEELQINGVCSTSLLGDLEWRKGQPPHWADEAPQFRVTEIWECNSFDAIISALQLGAAAVVFGIELGSNFSPDARGVIGRKRGRGGGHCQFAYGCEIIDGTWHAAVRNSWGNWGLNGDCFMPESYFPSDDVYGAWGVRVVTQGVAS